jgi:hypothetical protein
MSEPLGLAGYPAGHLLQVSGHVRELNPEAADPVRKLVDQTFAIRGDGHGTVHYCGLCNRHRCIPPDGQIRRLAHDASVADPNAMDFRSA